MDDFWADTPIISMYTRQQALQDGLLVDVSEMAKEAGIPIPVAVTQRVWNEYITPDVRAIGQSIEGRLWDTLNNLFRGALNNQSKSEFTFTVLMIMKARQLRAISFRAELVSEPDESAVITISLQDED